MTFDAAWADKWMKPKVDKPLPPRRNMTKETWARATVLDRAPGQAVELSRIWFPYGAKYVFYAPAKGRVALTGRTRPSKARDADRYGPGSLKGAVKINAVGGKRKYVCDAPGKDGGAIEVELPAAGFYELAAKVSGGDFALESACVPVAVDTRGGNLTMLFDGGKDATFWFDAPASGTVAMVRGGTYSGSCANVAFTDADGQPAGQVTADGDWRAVYAPDGKAVGLWKMVFSKIKGKPYSFYALDMASQPGLFFLSPEKTWRFPENNRVRPH